MPLAVPTSPLPRPEPWLAPKQCIPGRLVVGRDRRGPINAEKTQMETQYNTQQNATKHIQKTQQHTTSTQQHTIKAQQYTTKTQPNINRPQPSISRRRRSNTHICFCFLFSGSNTLFSFRFVFVSKHKPNTHQAHHSQTLPATNTVFRAAKALAVVRLPARCSSGLLLAWGDYLGWS